MLGGFSRLQQLLAGLQRRGFGTTLRMTFSLSLLLGLFLTILLYPRAEEPPPVPPGGEQLDRALELAREYERENRELQRALEAEQRLRRVANQTTAALAAQIRELDEAILDSEQRLAFYRQLLEERGGAAGDIAIRTFEILPDYREDSHQLVVVLSQPGDSDSFTGELDLVLSLRDEQRGEFEFRPAFAPGLRQVNFRYYIEYRESFIVPAGAEIVNGQLVLRDAEGAVVSSRILREQGF